MKVEAVEVYRQGERIFYKIICPRPKCNFAPVGYNKKLIEEHMIIHMDGDYCRK